MVFIVIYITIFFLSLLFLKGSTMNRTTEEIEIELQLQSQFLSEWKEKKLLKKNA